MIFWEDWRKGNAFPLCPLEGGNTNIASSKAMSVNMGSTTNILP